MHLSTPLALLVAGLVHVSSAGSGGHTHLRSLLNFKHEVAHKRQAAALNASQAMTKRKAGPGFVKKRTVLKSRKTVIGTGDSVTVPSNLAPGSDDGTKGCTIWHTVAPGEVCLGLIDKSPGFSLDDFYTFNPSVTAPCTNLQEGLAYCVDDHPNGPAGTESDNSSSSASPSSTKGNAIKNIATVALNASPKVSATASASTSDDCDDDEGDDSGDDDDCEDDDDDGSTSATAQNTPAPKAAHAQWSSSSSSSSPPAPSSSGSSGSDSDFDYSGIATYYLQNGNAGNCGNYNPDSALIVALYTGVYGSGEYCGKTVTLKNTSNGNTVTATVADSCPSCSQNGNIDCSEGTFKALTDGNFNEGETNVVWSIND